MPTEAGVRSARSRTVESLRRLGLKERYLFPVELSLHEALINALVHGVQESGASHIRLSYELDDRCVRVRVEDDGGEDGSGGAFDTPRQGLGLTLIHGLMSRVTVTAAGHGVFMELDCVLSDGSSPAAFLPITGRRSGVFH